MAAPTGLEPATSGVTGRRTNQDCAAEPYWWQGKNDSNAPQRFWRPPLCQMSYSPVYNIKFNKNPIVAGSKPEPPDSENLAAAQETLSVFCILAQRIGLEPIIHSINEQIQKMRKAALAKRKPA